MSYKLWTEQCELAGGKWVRRALRRQNDWGNYEWL